MKQFKQVGLPVLSTMLVCFYPCAFLFFQNAGEARAVDMLPFFGIFLLMAAAAFLIFDLVLKNVARAAVLTDLAMLAVIHFTLVCDSIKRLLPWFRDKIFLIFVLTVLIGLTILLRRKKPNMTVLCGLILLGFGSMTAVNLCMALPTLIASASYEKKTVGLDEEFPDHTFSGEKRNVYYFIFDEYGGPENLEHYYQDDNQEFLGGLEDRGFSVSKTTRNTESCWTVTLIPNMLNLDYVTDDSVPINNRLEWLSEPMLYKLFWANDYQINLINQNGFLGEDGCRLLSQKQRDETISDYLYHNSVLCQIPKLKWVIERRILHRGPHSEIDSLKNVSAALENCWSSAKNGPTLTVSYFMSPHAPFICDEAGRPLPPEDFNNWRKPELYMEKVRYTNGVILNAVDNIQKHDPDAVILLQADHGCRLPGNLVNEYGGPWFDAEAEIPYMENALCCAYIPGNPIDIEGDTCINATRKTLDAVFGLKLGTLPVPRDYTIDPGLLPPPPKEDEKHEKT